jgi:imidazolonepropionase-like amidohydrolase
MLDDRRASGTVVIDHVTVIDGTGAPPQADMTVVVSGGRIEAVGHAAAANRPPGARLVEGAAKFLIPGLWDSHVHSFLDPSCVETMFPVFVAHGIVGIRDTHGDLALAKRTRAEVAAGTRLGPRIITPGILLDGTPPIIPTGQGVATESEARAAVRERKASGVDYVKVYSRLSREAYFAIADEAATLNIPFAGHVPSAVTAAEASDAGQCAFEHLMGVEMSVSTEEDALRRRQMEVTGEFEPPDAAVIRKTYSRKRANELFARFVRNQTWQCPTLVVARALGAFLSTDFNADPRMRYFSPWVRQLWEIYRTIGERLCAGMGPLEHVYRELTGELWRAGVPILAGSDTPNPLVFPGSSLHEELEFLVEAGLTPLAALQAATIQPARFLGRLDSQGTVETGKVADLVLLDANPLDDIRNTQRIAAVVLAGAYLDRAALDGLLEQAAQAAAGEAQ